MDTKISVVIADDHQIFLEGLKLVLKKIPEILLIGEALNGVELLNLVTKKKPAVVLTDIKMPDMDGIQACKEIRQNFPDIQVIAISMFDDEYMIVDMLEAGARGYLLKSTNKSEILLAIQTVLQGDTYYCKETSSKLTKLIADSRFDPFNRSSFKSLTEREKDIIALICEQYSNKEIAAKLKISSRTVETHREKIHEKIGARNSIGIAIYAMRHNLIKI